MHLLAGRQRRFRQRIWKEGHMRVQCTERFVADARRRQLVAAQAEIRIKERPEKEKLAGN